MKFVVVFVLNVIRQIKRQMKAVPIIAVRNNRQWQEFVWLLICCICCVWNGRRIIQEIQYTHREKPNMTAYFGNHSIMRIHLFLEQPRKMSLLSNCVLIKRTADVCYTENGFLLTMLSYYSRCISSCKENILLLNIWLLPVFSRTDWKIVPGKLGTVIW